MSIFLKFGAIQGDVQDASHSNWIQLKSVNWTMSRPVTNPGGSTAGQILSGARVAELLIAKDEDVATIPLLQSAFEGTPVAAQIDFCRTGSDQQIVYYTIELKNALITSFSQASVDNRPMETMSLNFTQINFSGSQMDADGSAASPASYGWDLQANASA